MPEGTDRPLQEPRLPIRIRGQLIVKFVSNGATDPGGVFIYWGKYIAPQKATTQVLQKIESFFFDFIIRERIRARLTGMVSTINPSFPKACVRLPRVLELIRPLVPLPWSLPLSDPMADSGEV